MFLVKSFRLTTLLLYRVYYRFECLRVVHGEVGEDLAVESDVLLGEFAHELGIRESVLTSRGVDTLDPECAECAFLPATVAIGIGETFLVSVLGYGPDIPPGEEVTAGSAENLLAASP